MWNARGNSKIVKYALQIALINKVEFESLFIIYFTNGGVKEKYQLQLGSLAIIFFS